MGAWLRLTRLPAGACVVAVLIFVAAAGSMSAVGSPSAGPPSLSAADLESSSPQRQEEALVRLAAAVASQDEDRRKSAWKVLAAWQRERTRRIVTAGPPWQAADARRILALMIVDPARFTDDAPFRRRVLDRLPEALPDATPEDLRDLLLEELYTELGHVPFEDSEAIELAWGAARRDSAARRVELGGQELRLPDDFDPIRATLLSLPSTYVDPTAAARLIDAVRHLAPARRLLTLADPPTIRALERTADDDVILMPTYGRPFTPWPRDPFSIAEADGGRLVLVERSGIQRGREEDAYMGRELVQSLPQEVDEAWGGLRWGRARFFFHNGHILSAGGRLWVSLHSLERQILEILNLERVPVESFATAEGIEAYLTAAHRAAREMEALFGRPVSLVHPLPAAGSLEQRRQLMARIGGGAGLDLDTLLTLLPRRQGGLTAFVGDLAAGRELVEELAGEELLAFGQGYAMRREPNELRNALLDYQDSHRARRVESFLDLMSEHLAASGLTVRRLPLLLVPVDLLEDPARFTSPDFVLGWQNVVLDRRGGGVRAEGFASLIRTGDRRARAAYDRAGVPLDLLPPLIGSVVLNGGYRCASHQVRTPSAAVRDTGTPSR